MSEKTFHIIMTCLPSIIMGVVCIIVALLVFKKYLIQEKRCTSMTAGTVKKYSFAQHGGAVWLPIVYYKVDGREYHTMGPEFKNYIIYTKPTINGMGKNVSWHVDEKGQFVLERTQSPFVSAYRNPLAQVFPLGMQINVYYDPNKPRLAYVLKYCNKKSLFWLIFLLGVGIFIVGIVGILIIGI